MHYVFFCQDRPDSLPARLQVRPAHLARIQALVDENRVLIAGPMPIAEPIEANLTLEAHSSAGFSGSVIIAEFESLEAAQRWIAADPYVTSGVFQSVDVRPFKRVLP